MQMKIELALYPLRLDVGVTGFEKSAVYQAVTVYQNDALLGQRLTRASDLS